MKNITKALSENIIENTDLILGNMDRATIILLNSQEVRDSILLLQEPSQDYFSALRSYDSLIYSSYMVTTTREFFITAFFGKDGKLLVSSSAILNENPNLFFNTNTGQKIDSSPHTILSPSENSFEFEQIKNPIVCIRPMLNPSLASVAGFVAIFIDANRLSERKIYPVVDTSTILTIYSTMILNASMQPININTTNFNLATNKYVSSTTASGYSGWSATVGLPVKDYLEIAFRDKLLALQLPLLIVVVATIGLLHVLRRTLHPLKDLVRNLQYVRNGDYSHILEEATGFSDIDIIFSDFNSMTREIDRLINTVYANELLFHKVQLQMLKSQINPHFLYNTLQTIEAIGEINDVPQVSEIAHLLGNLLKYNLNSKEIVSLSEEIDSLKEYFKIQQIRFEESIIYYIRLEEGSEELQIPKFIMQPVIENCVVHGQCENSEKPLTVTITSKIDDTRLIITVHDNGNGINISRLEELRTLLKDGVSGEEASHIGLLNVNKRLKTRFGQCYGLTLESRENEYTEITYIIPVRSEEYSNVYSPSS